MEQIDDAQMKNPMTDEDQELTEPGEGFEPALETDPDNPESEGPPTGGRSPSPL